MWLLLLVIVTYATAISAPPDTLWTRVIDTGTDEQCRYLVELDDETILFAGSHGVYTTPTRDLMVVRMTADGTVLSTDILGSEEAEGFYAGCSTTDDAIVMVGYSGLDPDYDAYAFKVTNNGDSVWARKYFVDYGDPSLGGVCELPGGDLLMCGVVILTDGNRQGWLMRTDSDGDTVWTKHYGDENLDYFRGQISLTADGHYLLVGETRNTVDGRYNYWLVKVDANGNVIFDRNYGGEDIDRADCATEIGNGTYIVGGSSYSYSVGSSGNTWLLQTTSGGDSINSYHLGDERACGCSELLATDDRGFISSNGRFNVGTTYWDAWLVKIDVFGNIAWEVEMVGDSMDHILEMTQTDDGYIMGGITTGVGSTTYDAWVLRFGEESVFDLTVRPHYNTPHMKLIWNAPYPGDYHIFSTFDPDLTTIPPGPGWDLLITIPSTIPGMGSWDHDNAMTGGDYEYRRYQIIWEP